MDLFAPQNSERHGVLFVCTGNICRSALAEVLLRSSLPPQTPLEVSSAGLHAVVGARIDTIPGEIAVRLGADPDRHRARQIDRRDVNRAAIILTMTVDQRTELLTEFPAALNRTFTLTEFVALTHGVPAGSLPSLLSAATANRSLVSGTAPEDIEDPFKRSRETHERVGAAIAQAVQQLTSALQRA